jgi:hypothetical protein
LAEAQVANIAKTHVNTMTNTAFFIKFLLFVLFSALHKTQKNNNINELGVGRFMCFLLSNSTIISTAYRFLSAKKPLFSKKFASSKGGWRAKKLAKNTS